jgi:Tfp pilus assembly protein PilX
MTIRARARNTVARGLPSATSDQGIALVLSLIVLLGLSALVLAFLAMSAFEPQISQNLVDITNARMLADSGIEFAYHTLVNTQDWNTVLAGATAATCVAGNPGILLGLGAQPLPGLSLVHGTYTVRIRNDCQLTDSAMTGVLAEPSTNFRNDTNSRVVVESTGSKNNAAHTITAVIRRATIPSPTAALGFPGVQANISGSSFVVDGRDTRLSDVPGTPTGTAPSLFGITVSTLFPAFVGLVQTALAQNQPNEVYGRNPNGPGTVQGDAAVTTDAGLTSQMVIDFANAVKGLADVMITSSSANPFSIRDIGTTCAGNISDAGCWGTDARPRIVYVKGELASPDERFTSLDISGNGVGTGILIVENGTVGITGDFQWHGPVIVTGSNVSIQYRGGGDQRIVGGTIVNELHNDGGTTLAGALGGTARMLYSQEALDLVGTALKRRLTTVYGWRER